ncbi:hypothetical protein AAFC00_000790 [Neodothiora populina]|uniref:Major facilitator superfamily (MFS) profile domain-containing protein n=1 Tax=Neodothiora populina TaxID=2781224 RepID=A0ABR3PLT1_9PEZI
MAEEKEISATHQTSLSSAPTATSYSQSVRSEDDDISIHTIQVEGARNGEPREQALEKVVSYASGAEGYADAALRRNATGATIITTHTTDPAFEIDWEENDSGNPKNWPLWYKSFIIFAMSYGTSTVVLYSTSYTSSIPGLQVAFGINETTGILGVTTYLLGMAVGSVILAPLSEMYGRRPIYIMAMALFVVLVLPCALAKNIEAILITRFFGALAASAMISNAPGSVNDIVVEEYRALAFSIWSIGPMNGPVFGPVIGGFTFQYLGWRWTNWMVMILSGAGFFLIAMVKETYAPALLRKRAAQRRKETGDDRWFSRYDEKKEFLPLLKVNMSRPFVMVFTEPICIFWDVYIAIVYGVLYLCFVAYPIVFTDLRGWSYGISGLAFCGIGAGTLITIVCEPLLRRMINAHKRDPETGELPPEAMVSVVCIGAVLLAIGEIWFAWTCTKNVHWIVPILAGIPFGAGNSAVFIYSSNYLVHSYSIYAASALAGNAVLRSVMGACLPLAGPSMYATLGPHWAGTLLGLVEVICIPIPVIFYYKGAAIRKASALISRMREDQKRQDDKRLRAAEKNMEKEAMQRGDAEAYAGGVGRTGAAIYEERDIEKGRAGAVAREGYES